ncbi:hypothetical protein [Sinorhizobium meliloti]|uniref:hypothetical protein n=1 Tax=Rhizobium meliloti TaxID=382 RepID=UPI0013E408DB|nr:hypothetical protein [Sinorhizobium meliloti]
MATRLHGRQAKEALGDDWQGWWCRMTMMAEETTVPVPFPSSRYRSRPEIHQP